MEQEGTVNGAGRGSVERVGTISGVGGRSQRYRPEGDATGL